MSWEISKQMDGQLKLNDNSIFFINDRITEVGSKLTDAVIIKMYWTSTIPLEMNIIITQNVACKH